MSVNEYLVEMAPYIHMSTAADGKMRITMGEDFHSVCNFISGSWEENTGWVKVTPDIPVAGSLDCVVCR
jgi:hypothetical protein